MSVKIKLRRDTTTNWEAINPVLATGEPGFESDTGRLKIGNGTDPWNELSYLSGEGGSPVIMEDIDDRVADLLVAGDRITLTYNDNLNSLTISAAQTYDAAVVWTPNHTLADGTRYLANDLVYESGRLYKANFDNESLPVSNTQYWTDVGPGYRLNIDGRDIPNIPNIFDQSLNTSDTPTFVGVNLSNGTTLAQGTFDNGTGGNSGISLNCYVGYELNWQGGHLRSTPDGGSTSADIIVDSNIVLGTDLSLKIPNTQNDPSDPFTYAELSKSELTIGYAIGSSDEEGAHLTKDGLRLVNVDALPFDSDNMFYGFTGITFPDGTFQGSAVSGILSGTNMNVVNVSGAYTVNHNGDAAVLKTIVFNNTGSQIPKLSAVYLSGGQGETPTVALANASSEATSSKTYGIAAENIDNMSSGVVVTFGALSGVNTDQFNPTAPVGDVNGTILWLSPSVSGGLTTIKPYAPNNAVALGTIVRTHQNEGIIEVRVQNGFELEELHDVAVTGVTNRQYLQFNSASNLWIPTSSGNFAEVSYTIAQVPVSTNQNDLALPSGAVIRLNPSTSGLSITGMTAGSDGQIKMVFNAGSNAITLAHYSASSAIQNRFVVYNGSNYTLQSNNAVTMMYDGSSAVWRIF